MAIAYSYAYVQTETDWNFTFHLRPSSRYCVFWCRTL